MQAPSSTWALRLRWAAQLTGALLLTALLGTLVLQVTARLMFQRPLPWTDELAVVLLIWSLFWAAAVVVHERDQVAIDWVFQALPARWQRSLGGLACATVAGLVAWALPACVDYVRVMQAEPSAVLGLPLAWVYSPMLLWLVSLVLRYGWLAWRAWWPAAPAPWP
jgi:TRAP-type C4-dicarboxylate transport system permease small subunit